MQDLWQAARNPPVDPTHLSFKNKAVLVTGANSGLGHQAAIKYAALGANPLILAVRSEAKGEAAKAEIIKSTNCSPEIFVIETVDLATFASVEQFCQRLKARVPRLHILQLVAGISTFEFKKSPAKYELSMQVNLLSTVLMALLLLPAVRAAAAEQTMSGGFMPHISFVNSMAHLEVDPEWIPEGQTLLQRINDPSKYNQVQQYYLVKLAAMFAIRGLIERLGSDSDKIVINATCPGMCKTNMGNGFPVTQRMFMAIFYIFFGKSAEAGSRCLVSATALGKDSQGKLWTNDKIVGSSKFMESERGNDMYRETWNEMLAILRSNAQSDLS
jgi:NAD(P)-dependent dehydrogenase (short-subunit alcohol dehydrogenase family)